jgi:1-phosphofructokinase
VVMALRTGTACLTGSKDPASTPVDLLERVAADLRAGGVQVVADLSGVQLEAALRGGLSLLKVSHSELLDAGYATDEDERSVLEGMSRLLAAGADDVVVSRSSEPTLATIDGVPYRVEAPSFSVVEPHGAGDAMTGALTAATARRFQPDERLRLAAAAGALNAARKGYGTGRRDAIEELAGHVNLIRLADHALGRAAA